MIEEEGLDDPRQIPGSWRADSRVLEDLGYEQVSPDINCRINNPQKIKKTSTL